MMSDPHDRDAADPITDDARDWLHQLAATGAADADETRQLVQLFIADSTTRSGGLHDAAAAGDLAGVRSLAHELRGSSATFGAHLVAAICRQAEEAAAAGDADGMRRALAPLDVAMAEAATVLAKILPAGGELNQPSDG